MWSHSKNNLNQGMKHKLYGEQDYDEENQQDDKIMTT